MHVRNVEIPAPEQGAVDRFASGDQPSPYRDRQTTISGDSNVGLDEFERSGVQIDPVAEQIRPKRGNRLGCADQLSLFSVCSRLCQEIWGKEYGLNEKNGMQQPYRGEARRFCIVDSLNFHHGLRNNFVHIDIDGGQGILPIATT